MALERDHKKFVRAERRRCLELVEGYRDHLQTTLDRVRSDPKYQNAQYRVANLVVEKVIASLKDMEDKIRDRQSKDGADFSMEELEKAEAIIAEQNKNPFEA